MSEHDEKIESFQDGLRKIAEADLAHDELGVANGFHDANAVKDSACSYLGQILERLAAHLNDLNDAVITEKLTQIDSGSLRSKSRSNKSITLRNLAFMRRISLISARNLSLRSAIKLQT